MSETEHQATSILLPAARVAVFSRDDDTLNSAKTIKEDWRFARVEFDILEGGVETAIQNYEKATSPDLLIIQTEDIDDGFTDLLGALSAHCEEGTAAVIIGPVNDVNLYRELIDMGVSDYLVRPLSSEAMSEVIAKTLITRLGVSDSRLIAFMGAKGGVGTSTLAQLSSWLVSEKMGQKALLMDAAGGWSPLSVGMGFDPSATLFEISRAVEAKNEDSIKRMCHAVSDKLSVLASGSDAMLDPSVSTQQYEAILDNMMVKYPIVLVDLSCADAALRKTVISRANQIITATTPTVTSLRFCRSLLKEISDIRGGDKDKVSLVVNMQGASKANEVGTSDLEEALDHKTSAVLSYDPNLLLKHESEIRALLSDKDGQSLITAILPILKKTITDKGNGSAVESDAVNGGLLGGFLGKLKK